MIKGYREEELNREFKEFFRSARFSGYWYLNIEIEGVKDLEAIAGISYDQENDYIVLKINSDEFLKLNRNQKFGTLIHEMLHVIHGHFNAEDYGIDITIPYEKYLTNVAQDMVINEYINSNKSNFLQEGDIYIDPDKFLFLPKKLKSKKGTITWIEVYRWLKENAKITVKRIPLEGNPQNQQKGKNNPLKDKKGNQSDQNSSENSKNDGKNKKKANGTGASGTVVELEIDFNNGTKKKIRWYSIHDYKNGSKIPKSEIQRITQRAIQKARSDGVGTVPGGIEELIRGIYKKKINLRKEIKSVVDFMSQQKREYSWRRLDRKRFLQSGTINKYLAFEKSSKVFVAIDTSGSMDNKFLKEAYSAINYLLDTYTVKVIEIDAAIQRVRDFTKEVFERNLKKLTVKGRGGTVFKDLFNNFVPKEMKNNWTLLVITDGGIFDLEDLKPHHNTIWLTNNVNVKFPFGRKIYFEVR